MRKASKALEFEPDLLASLDQRGGAISRDAAPLRRFALEFERGEVLAAEHLNSVPVPRPSRDVEKLWGEGLLWGPRWHGHPFTEPRLLRAMQLTEPQVTREFAYWFSTPGHKGASRRKAFVEAVLDCVQGSSPVWQGHLESGAITHAAESDPTAVARKHARAASRRNGAVDLFFIAGRGHGGCALVIEAKIDAPFDANQLRRYRDQTRRRLESPAYVYLARVAPPQKISGWAFCSWQALLANLETRLHAIGDDDPSFRLFRSQLFWRVR